MVRFNLLPGEGFFPLGDHSLVSYSRVIVEYFSVGVVSLLLLMELYIVECL